ncbi:MAG: ATP synthase F1 subunit delta [Lachnospiraceae bacterium]|nr:ATP synthase F1 subunit delta [Lachnospiraceae bacterium]
MTKTAAAYGNGLYELAAEENICDEILSEVGAVDKILRDNPDYLRILSENSIPKQERFKLIDDAFSGKINKYLLNFMKILFEKGYIRDFSGCARQYVIRYNEANGISEAVVTSAVELDELQKEALIRKLETISGRKIILKERIDRSIVAGLKVEMDGIQYDGSASGRLKTIRKNVSDIIV